MTCFQIGGGIAAVGGAFLCSRFLSRTLFGGEPETHPLEEWTQLGEEEAIEPELVVFDPHHHLWDPFTQPKGWPVHPWVLKLLGYLKPAVLMKIMQAEAKKSGTAVFTNFGDKCMFTGRYMARDYMRDMKIGQKNGHKISGTVYIECGWQDTTEPLECLQVAGEADFCVQVHKDHPVLCQGIVARAELKLGKDVEPLLERYSRMPLVKGIRRPLAFTDEPNLFSDPHVAKDDGFNEKFREGFALLSKYNLSFDTWMYHEQMDALADLANAFPQTTIICDHLGYPLGIYSYKREEVFPKWKEGMAKLAACPNVHMKISGFGSRVFGFGFDEQQQPPSSKELADAIEPYVKTALDLFGFDRCMFASNFPVDKVSCSFNVLYNAFKLLTREYPADVRRKLFEANAKRIYRIDAEPGMAKL